MKNAAFDEFVKSQQEPEHPEIDWDKERDEWLLHLDELYNQILKFVKEYIDAGQMQFAFQPIELDEENIGSYTARQLTLRIGRKKIKFLPAGRFLSGWAKGRVDVIGPSGTEVPLVLVESKATRPTEMLRNFLNRQELRQSPIETDHGEKWSWKMVTRPPDRFFIELTQKEFFRMILEVANG
jgi:hypothetical protein